MKRRNLILSFVAIALLLIGLGYAAIEDTLTVETKVSTAVATLDLDITAVSAIFNEGENIANTVVSIDPTGKDDTAVIDYNGFTNAGDKLVVVLNVTNTLDNGLAAKLVYSPADLTETSADGYFKVTYVAEKTGASFDTAGNLLDGKATQVTVTIELLKTPVETKTATFTLTVTGTAAEAA